jgi:hypothetical protein
MQKLFEPVRSDSNIPGRRTCGPLGRKVRAMGHAVIMGTVLLIASRG